MRRFGGILTGRVRSLGLTVLFIAGALAARPLAAQQKQRDKDVDTNKPILVVNVASVERLLSHAVTTFEAAGRPELSETLGGALARVNDLKGMNRNQSVGLMLFLNGFQPEPVVYVPVKNIDELMKTVEIGPVTTKKIADDRYEILANRQTLHVKVQGDFAFLTNEKDYLDRNFSDPSKLTGRLSASYDIAAMINLKSVAPATKDLFLNIFRANAENDLQRRDNEPEAAHRVRKAAGMRNLEVMEALLGQGEELTIGWTVANELAGKSAALEIVLLASPGTEMASYLNELKAARSHFANLLKDTAPLSGSVSWKLDKSAKKMFKEIISAVETQMTAGLAANSTEAESNPVKDLSKVLNATAEAGKVDAAFQFIGQPPAPFVFIGGMKIEDTDTLSSALENILGRLKGNPKVSDVKLNALSHKGVTVHRLETTDQRPGEDRLYGGKPGIYLGTGNSVFWIAVGGDEAVNELKRAIDKVSQPVPDTAVTYPIQFVMNFSSWMEIFDPDNKAEGFAARARNAFSKGGDALRIDVKPIDDGVRFRLQFDEAFLRLIGQEAAQRIDRRQQP